MQDPVGNLYNWLMGILTSWGLVNSFAHVLITLLGIIILVVCAMVLDVFLVWIERKVVARFQDRLGPNRIGPWGIFQPFADIIKLLIKEDITPTGADVFVFNLAPILSLASVLLLWAVLPIAGVIYGVDLNVALLYVVAAGAIGTLSIIMAGWSSNNKFALVGAYRMVANMISYEIPMVVILLIPAILTGSMSMLTIAKAQSQYWFVWVAPLAAVVFLISAIAELGRSPFDLNEGESEIVSGFHIEYSGMKFGLFYAGELLHAFTFGAFISIFFFGGYNGPGVSQMPVLGIFYFFIRIDHMLYFNWKFLVPFSIVILIMTAIMHKLLSGSNTTIYILGMLVSNIILGLITIEILRSQGRKQRRAVDTAGQVVIDSAHH
jgi:NADH-quinone oxidoreductase subunit H